MTADPDRWRRGVRLALVGFAVLALCGAGYWVFDTPPTPSSAYPKCLLHTATGLHCPGCGTGRAAHAALHCRLGAAARFNALAAVLLPVLLILAARGATRWALGRPTPRRHLAHPRWLWLLLAGLVVFTVLRNIPAEPFRHFAPEEVGDDVSSDAPPPP